MPQYELPARPPHQGDDYKLPGDIDKEIYPLIEILNQTGYIRTTTSCAGYTPVEDGIYKRHVLGELTQPWLHFEPYGDALKCASLLEYVFKRLGNAYYWGVTSSNPVSENLNPDARRSFEFYEQAGASHLFWLDKPTFLLNWRLRIYPILKEGDLESLRQWGIEKPTGIVRTKTDIRKIYQLIEMAVREFEHGDTIEVPALPTLEEQYEATKEFLWNLPYFYMGAEDMREDTLAWKIDGICCMDGRPRMDEAIYVVGPNIGRPISWSHVGNFCEYTQVTELAKHLAIRLRNNHLPQFSFCTNLLKPQEMQRIAKPHQFYKEADALHLFEESLPLMLIFEEFCFEVGELDYDPHLFIPTRVMEGQDVLKVWQLFEMAVRDFIEQREDMDIIGSPTRAQKATKSILTKGVNQEAEGGEWRNQNPTCVFGHPKDMPMVLIPAGEFMMGSNDEDYDDERPMHTVYLDAFYMDAYEVTNAQYQKFMEVTGHKAPEYWHHPRFKAPDQPVIGVNWHDAMAYCEKPLRPLRFATGVGWETPANGSRMGKSCERRIGWETISLGRYLGPDQIE